MIRSSFLLSLNTSPSLFAERERESFARKRVLKRRRTRTTPRAGASFSVQSRPRTRRLLRVRWGLVVEKKYLIEDRVSSRRHSTYRRNVRLARRASHGTRTSIAPRGAFATALEVSSRRWCSAASLLRACARSDFFFCDDTKQTKRGFSRTQTRC